MAHKFFGVQAAEDHHHAHQHDHDHFHDHADTAQAERATGFWLFITMAGGLLVVSSYLVQLYSIATNAITIETLTNSQGQVEEVKNYWYQFHMDLVAGIGALFLASRIIWHALGNLIRGHMHMDELVALAIVASFGTGDYRAAGVIAFFLLLAELVETRTAIGARASIDGDESQRAYGPVFRVCTHFGRQSARHFVSSGREHRMRSAGRSGGDGHRDGA